MMGFLKDFKEARKKRKEQEAIKTIQDTLKVNQTLAIHGTKESVLYTHERISQVDYALSKVVLVEDEREHCFYERYFLALKNYDNSKAKRIECWCCGNTNVDKGKKCLNCGELV